MSGAYQTETFIRAIKGGARSNLFWVVPLNGTVAPKYSAYGLGTLPYLVKASSFPSTEMTDLAPKFKGRSVPIPGDRTFGDWNMSVYIPPSHTTRRMFIDWSDSYNDLETNVRERAKSYEDIYKEFAVFQATTENTISYAIKISGAMCTNVGQVALDNDSTNLETFEVGVKYQFWNEIEAANELTNLASIVGSYMKLDKTFANIVNITASSVATVASDMNSNGSRLTF